MKTNSFEYPSERRAISPPRTHACQFDQYSMTVPEKNMINVLCVWSQYARLTGRPSGVESHSSSSGGKGPGYFLFTHSLRLMKT